MDGVRWASRSPSLLLRLIDFVCVALFVSFLFIALLPALITAASKEAADAGGSAK